MQAIYSSKLFKTSKFKKDIISALNNPANVELVQQLKEYIDEDSIPEDIKNPKVDDTEVESETPEKSADKSDKLDSKSEKDIDKEAPRKSDYKLSKMMKEDSFGDESGDAEPAEPSEPEEVKESVQANCCILPNISKDEVQGLLNSRQDTAGVVRVNIKDSELWIHYNDDTNLNDVMENVIALLNAADYAYLDFNRLARTENAIVFFINKMMKDVDSIVEDE